MKLYFASLLMLLSQAFSEEIEFGRDVLPILSDKCFHCHGPDEKHRKAKLRLDTFEGATKVKEGTAAIVPGSPEKSYLIELIETDDKDDIMPPVKTEKKLTAKEINILKTWIKSGAKYEKHWAFVKPQKANLPKLKKNDWVLNEIDHFILSRLEKKSIAPAKDTESYTLIRRLYLDLTGLPPAPEVVKQFLKNPSPKAYEKIVDSLLNSNAYAEKMAMIWMDAARYSDTDGFQQDQTRNNWPWRDWVVQAYKKNMPFDQFTKVQIAGDLFPKAT